MFEEHMSENILLALVICSMVITLAIVIVSAILLFPLAEQRAASNGRDRAMTRDTLSEERKKFVKAMIHAATYK